VDAPADDPAPPPSGPARWLEDAERLDGALYAAIAQTPTPALAQLTKHARTHDTPPIARSYTTDSAAPLDAASNAARPSRKTRARVETNQQGAEAERQTIGAAPRCALCSPRLISHVAKKHAHLDKAHRTGHRSHHPNQMTRSHDRRVRSQRRCNDLRVHVATGTKASHSRRPPSTTSRTQTLLTRSPSLGNWCPSFLRSWSPSGSDEGQWARAGHGCGRGRALAPPTRLGSAERVVERTHGPAEC
jgi:hypothetical protein